MEHWRQGVAPDRAGRGQRSQNGEGVETSIDPGTRHHRRLTQSIFPALAKARGSTLEKGEEDKTPFGEGGRELSKEDLEARRYEVCNARSTAALPHVRSLSFTDSPHTFHAIYIADHYRRC
eukprot:2800688-Pleurochrysis_carterae.AAC.1